VLSGKLTVDGKWVSPTAHSQALAALRGVPKKPNKKGAEPRLNAPTVAIL
jgi:hypothetical protein